MDRYPDGLTFLQPQLAAGTATRKQTKVLPWMR
jgi:hypothetical protein